MSARGGIVRLVVPCLIAVGLSTVSGSAPHGDALAKRLPFYDDADFTPSWSADGARHTIADFSLVDQSGETVTRADMSGQIAVVSFVFTSCQGICPKIVGNLLSVQHTFADDARVMMLSYSVWPQIDTVQELEHFGAEKGIDPEKWRLLTGDRDAIYALARGSYFADPSGASERGAKAFIHTENVWLIDGRGHIRGVYNGTVAFDMTRLSEDIRILERSG